MGAAISRAVDAWRSAVAKVGAPIGKVGGRWQGLRGVLRRARRSRAKSLRGEEMRETGQSPSIVNVAQPSAGDSRSPRRGEGASRNDLPLRVAGARAGGGKFGGPPRDGVAGRPGARVFDCAEVETRRRRRRAEPAEERGVESAADVRSPSPRPETCRTRGSCRRSTCCAPIHRRDQAHRGGRARPAGPDHPGAAPSSACRARSRASVPGPVITVYEFQPAPGVKVSQIVNLQDDLALALKAESVRIDRIRGPLDAGHRGSQRGAFD